MSLLRRKAPSPRTDTTVGNRYEFRPNEFVSVVKSVSLATRSTVSGRKDFIAVGTTVYRAEDLAARGGVSLSSPFNFYFSGHKG